MLLTSRLARNGHTPMTEGLLILYPAIPGVRSNSAGGVNVSTKIMQF